MKAKSAKYRAEQNEKKAKAKGFSSYQAFTTFSSAAKHEGEEKAKSKQRKTELQRIKQEAYDDRMAGKSGKYGRYQKKVQGGIKKFQGGLQIYNDMMGELQSLSSMPSSQPRKSSTRSTKKTKKRKPQKTKSKSRNKKPDFWDQFQ